MKRLVDSVGIVGAGTMGQGIARLAALAGYKVLLFDISADQLEKASKAIESSLKKGIEKGKLTEEDVKGALKRFIIIPNLSAVKADFIIEAAIENLEIKQKIFSELEEINEDDAILSTNTSSIPVTQIGKAVKNKNRFLGMHFFNPAHIMPLVEVVATPATDKRSLTIATVFSISLGKTPVIVKDSPGFIVNRVARHYYVESLKILEEKVAGVESIDRLLESTGFKMGPFRLMDLIGVDTNYAVTETMFQQFGMDPKFRPNRIQKQLVDAGYLGRKSGKGFYNYD